MKDDDLQTALTSMSGRALVHSLLDITGYFTDTFDHDTIKHAFNAGRRSVGVELINRIKGIDFDNYTRMLREHEYGHKNDS